MEDAFETGQLLDSEKQLKKRARALYEQFYKEGKQKEVIRATEIVRELGELFPEVRKSYRNLLKLCDFLKPFHEQAKFVFALEQKRAEETGDRKALRALEYLKKNVNKPMSNSQKRGVGILKMLRDKVFTGTLAKDGGAKAYWVYASCGDRPLSDESWQGRFTVMDFRSGLEAMYGPTVAGDKEGRQVRRTLKALGIRPAEDQRGRKWKEPLPQKQEPKRPRGRRAAEPEIVRTGKLDDVLHANLDHRVNTRGYVLKKEYGKLNAGNTSYGGLSSFVRSARKELAAIDREIAKLELLRGGRRGKFVY
jgi:hypothetical protein